MVVKNLSFLKHKLKVGLCVVLSNENISFRCLVIVNLIILAKCYHKRFYNISDKLVKIQLGFSQIALFVTSHQSLSKS